MDYSCNSLLPNGHAAPCQMRMEYFFLTQESPINCPGATPATHYLHEPVLQTAKNQQKTQTNKLKKRTPYASKLGPNLSLHLPNTGDVLLDMLLTQTRYHSRTIWYNNLKT